MPATTNKGFLPHRTAWWQHLSHFPNHCWVGVGVVATETEKFCQHFEIVQGLVSTLGEISSGVSLMQTIQQLVSLKRLSVALTVPCPD